MGHEDSSSDESDALRDDQHLPFAAAFKKTKSLRSVPWLGLFSQSILLQWRGVVFCDLIPNSGTPAPDTPFCLRFGLTLVVGHSGKVNKKGKVPTIKDLLANQEDGPGQKTVGSRLAVVRLKLSCVEATSTACRFCWR